MSKATKTEIPPPRAVTVTIYECRGCGRRFATMEGFTEHAGEMCTPDAFAKAGSLDGLYVRTSDTDGFGRVSSVKGCMLEGRFFQLHEEDDRYEIIEFVRSIHSTEAEPSTEDDVRSILDGFAEHIVKETMANLEGAMGVDG